jgi:uncharacterized linocin/CFP29 family protein
METSDATSTFNAYLRREKDKDMATVTTLAATPTAPTGVSATGAGPQTQMPSPSNNMGRDKVHWAPEIWARIDDAVSAEMKRVIVGRQFLPRNYVNRQMTSVAIDSITGNGKAQALNVDEGATTRISEFWVEFSLTPQQVEHETRDLSEIGHSTAVTLATRAANLLAQAEDSVLWLGKNALSSPVFVNSVSNRGIPDDAGLLGFAADQRPVHPVQPASAGAPPVYAENTVGAVAQAYSALQERGHYGPYTLVLFTIPFADLYTPLKTTLIVPAIPVGKLMNERVYGTGTLVRTDQVPNVLFSGLVLSLGGNTMDLVIGLDATTTFMQQDTDGNYRFRVVERMVLVVKDSSAVVELQFMAQ